MPPARTENPVAPTRGLTHTIRWARRPRRAISAHEGRVAALPAVGEDHDHRTPGHAPAPVPVVEGLERLADPSPARPVRRRGGGALDRALRVARRDARVRRVSRVANANASALGPLPAAQVRNCR